MRPGEEYLCPKCGKNTFLKKESVMDGWTKKGEVLKCASCGALVCELKQVTASADPLNSTAADKFKSLLGEDKFVEKPRLSASGEEDHFCKDCKYLIPHPFVVRCGKFGKDVNPMDDCPSFEYKKDMEA